MNPQDSWFARARGMAAALVSEMSADSDGQFSASVYETGRLVALAPSLRGHRERVHFLLDHQHANGEWGGPDHYAIVPTLSATEALLRDIELGSGQRLPYPAMVSAAERGLRALFARLDGRAPILPDTVAIELIVPALIIDINEHLAGKAGLDSVADGRLLPAPDGANAALLARLRESVHQGRALPRTLLHSLEVIGTPVRGAPSVEPNRGGVGCSPAATAAWLGDVAAGGNHHPFVRYLESVQDVDGAVPVAAPLGLFERAWVLSTLAEAGLGSTAERSLVQSIHTEFGEWGVAGGPGLPPDADDTATALYALARYGRPRSPACLWAYRAGAHFSCFPGERTPSTSTNAHVLQAFGACLTPDLPERSDYLQAMARLTGWLADHQDDDGSWRDKWHASPYYATKCCVVALVEHGGAAGAAAASRAVRWVLDLQRPDGSWGHWVGTPEETAYALQILVRANDSGTGDVIARAAARGCAFLLRAGGHHEHPPLWHDKDLYTPMRIVRAEVLAGLHLAHTDRRVRALLSRGAAT